jgi:DNA polymerase
MNPELKKKVIESLKDQLEIFGDYLFEKNVLSKTPTQNLIKEKTQAYSELFDAREEWEKVTSLNILDKLICDCKKCELHKNRNKFVFGSGNPNADVMVIGEGPGAEEDIQGLPFVGRAGQLLTDILKAIKFNRDEVYIANVVKCRPPNNRTPSSKEMETCIPYLRKQISLIKPKMILCLGLTAAQGLLSRKETMGNLRGKFFDFENAKAMVTYHPAALLRNPGWKKDCWEDVKKFRKMYDSLIE